MSVTTLLHLLQPLARLFGRVRWGYALALGQSREPVLAGRRIRSFFGVSLARRTRSLEEVESTLKKLGLVVGRVETSITGI